MSSPDGSPCACIAVRRAARDLTRRYDASLRPVGLHVGHFSILATLATLGEATIGDLAARLGLDRTTLTRDLKPLQKQGMIASRRGNDPRARLVALTDAGRQRLVEAQPLWQRAQIEAHALLGEAGWQALFSITGSVAGAYQSTSDPAPKE